MSVRRLQATKHGCGGDFGNFRGWHLLIGLSRIRITCCRGSFPPLAAPRTQLLVFSTALYFTLALRRNSLNNMAPPVLTQPEEFKALLDSVDTFLLDCDGVIYHGANVVPGVKDTLQMLRKAGKKIIFVTNNAAKSRPQYLKTFEKLGIEAYTEEIFGSGYAAAVYLSSILKFPKDKRVYVIGEAGLEEELDSVGIGHAGGTVSL